MISYEGILSSPELSIPLGQRLARLSGAIRTRFQAQEGAEAADMRLTGLLLTIAADPGLTQRLCAERMGLDPTTFGRLVDQQEAQGLLRRAPHDSDRRAHALHLTPAGQARAQTARTRIAAIEEAILSRLSPEERAALDRGLAALARELRKG